MLPDLKNINAPNLAIIEKHQYYIRDGKHLFTAEYLPIGDMKAGVILCAPFAEEKVRTLRIYVSLARTLASLGVGTICFDYFGDGDSEGHFEEATFEDRLADIGAIYRYFKEKNSLRKIGLMGLRWGGTLASLISEELQPKFLILWEPVVDTSKYFYDHLRSYLASQMLIEGKASKNRDDLIKEMEAGQAVTVEGYNLTGKFFFKARENGLKGRKFSFQSQTLIVQIAPNPSRIRPELEELKAAFTNCDLVAIPREFEWEKTETWQPAPPRLFGETLSFLEKNEIF
jgi:uncharacterized protein